MEPANTLGSPFIARGRPRTLFAALMLNMMCTGLTLTAFVSALPEMAQSLGERGEFLAQMTMASAALGLMAGSLASGWVLQKAGTRLTLLLSLLIFGLAGADGMISQPRWLLLGSRFLVGFSSACVVTTCVWLIGAAYSGHQRARAFGLAGALSAAAGLMGAVLGGYLAQHGGWRLAFVQYPVLAAAALLLASVSIRQVIPQREAGGASRASFIGLWPFYLLVVLLFTIFAMGGAQFPFLLQLDGLRDPVVRSLVLGVTTITAILGSLSFGPLQRQLNPQGTFTLALVCMAVGLATVGWAIRPVFTVVGGAMMGFCLGLVGPYLYHTVTERTDAYSRGRHIGLLNALTFFGIFLNPILFAPITRAIGLRNEFLLAALIMTVAAISTRYRIRRARDLERL